MRPKQSPIKKQELWPSGRRWDFQINGQPANINILWQDLQNSQAVLIKRYFCGHQTVAHCIPQFASCYLRVCARGCVCVRGCTLDKVYSFLGDNFVSFAVGKRDTQLRQPAEHLRQTIHLCLNGWKQKEAFVWPRNWDWDRGWLWETETPAAAAVEVHSQLATVVAPVSGP